MQDGQIPPEAFPGNRYQWGVLRNSPKARRGGARAARPLGGGGRMTYPGTGGSIFFWMSHSPSSSGMACGGGYETTVLQYRMYSRPTFCRYCGPGFLRAGRVVPLAVSQMRERAALQQRRVEEIAGAESVISFLPDHWSGTFRGWKGINRDATYDNL